MTQAAPPSTRTRSSPRNSLKQTEKTKHIIKKPTRLQKLFKNVESDISTEIIKGAIVDICDFKKISGKTMYLVERSQPTNDKVWETEDMIECPDVLSNYQQRVFQDTGYPIDDQIAQPETNEQDNGSRQLIPRASKIRAVIALKHTDSYEEEAIVIDNKRSRGTKRKSNYVGGITKKSGSKRFTKADLLIKAQAEERSERREARRHLNPEEILCSLDHVKDMDCCLQCGANTYRSALEKNNLFALKAALVSKTIPNYTAEDKPNGLGLIEYAIMLQRENFADEVKKFTDNNDRSLAPDIPLKYKVYDGGNTGRNNHIGEYQRRSFKQVEESRGNRVGNSAFYRTDSFYTPKNTYMNVEDQMRYSALRPFMPYISKPVFKGEKVIDNYLVHFQSGSAEVYFSVASGNRFLAKSLIQVIETSGRSTFNHLHEEVLKYDGSKALTTYRKSQILKMASDAFNVSPYHCSAINPSSKYLAEFFEALDPAERLETDSLGRSIAFYAAVSETSDCLEFIETKGVNLSLIDKYKMTPLVQAARFGRSHNVEILIKHLRGGPDINVTPPAVFQTLNRNRRTALHYAAYFGHPETCLVLINYGAPVDCVESLIKQTPLHFAAKNGYVDCVRVLIEEGKANPEMGDKFVRTALHYACMSGHTEVVKYLLSQGVNANAIDSSRNTPCHFAAAFGYIKILHLLIEYGSADPSVSNLWRSTPCSVANMKGHVAIVKYILNLSNSTIDVNFKDQEGRTMLQTTILEPVDTILDKEANIEKASLLLSMKADVNSIDLDGNTCLHSLVSDNSYSSLKPKGWNTLYSVKTSYHSSPDKTEDDIDGLEYQVKLAELLVKYGANLDAKNSDQETPLAVAMRSNNHHLVACLIEAGSKFWADTDKIGFNFFHYFVKFLGIVCQCQPHNELDAIRKERYYSLVDKVWEAFLKKYQPYVGELKNIIDSVNNNGHTPVIYAVHKAIEGQKSALSRESKMILAAATYDGNSSYSYGNNNQHYIGPKFNDVPKPMNVSLKFNVDKWIELMDRIFVMFQPDMNHNTQLPKNFKKENPKAKRSDYPQKTGYTALHFASEAQSSELISFLLNHGSEPNVIVRLDGEVLSGDTPLITAYHNENLYKELASIKLRSNEKVTKNFVLSMYGVKEQLNDSIEALVRFGASPFIQNVKGNSALLKAASSSDIINTIAMCSATSTPEFDINTENEQGETALKTAFNSLKSEIEAKKEDVVYVNAFGTLLSAGADPNARYEDGDTVFMKVIKTLYAPLINVFFEKCVRAIDHTIQNKKHETTLIIACNLNVTSLILQYIQFMKSSKIRFELNVYDNEYGTALSYAAKNGDVQVVTELILLGADPNFYKPCHIPLIEAVSSQNIEVVETILKAGAQINVQDEAFGNSPLHAAIIVEKHRIVKLLLEHGADLNMQNSRKQTPMHLAIEATKRQTNRSFRVESLLMKAGADMHAADFFGRTPAHYIFVDSDLIPITRNTAVISKKVKQISKEMKQESDRAKVLNDYAEKFDLNPLAGGDNESVNYVGSWIKEAKQIRLDMAKKEALDEDLRIQNQDEEVTILEEEKELMKVYFKYGWETEALVPPRFDPIDILKYLSDIHALDFNAKDDFGRTPLHYAACVGAFSCTSFLIDQKVDINALDSDNNGPLQLALRNNYVDYSVMLCNFGATVNNDIVLKDGASTSTFGFSLSKSLINMAYLIMDRGVTLIESLRDALKNGKFHMVEILLQSAQDEDLSKTLPTDGQNMWHIVSNFKPFNHEIWEEYIHDIVDKLLKLKLSFFKDTHGRTPIHYAAKHGQKVLLDYLLAQPNIELGVIDSDEKSELCYAVESGNVDILKLLLKVTNGSKRHTNSKVESLVLKAVQSKHFDIVQTLLGNGFHTDEDSAFGRINSVMVACLNNDSKMLSLLIRYGADLNKASHVERKNKTGRKYNVLLHPIFSASVAGPKLLKMMLEAGANPNVLGPESKPESGRSLFTYNVALNNIENQNMLLDFNANLNLVDIHGSRSIFYQFYFASMKYGQNLKTERNYEETKLSFNQTIYQKMIKSSTAQLNLDVNTIDKLTGMTPLELAIREQNTVITEYLLLLGADVNTESCLIGTEDTVRDIYNPSGKKVPALTHAVIENNMEIVKIICSTAKQSIKWLWHNQENHNVLSYALGCIGDFSHENIEMIKYLASKMGPVTFKELVEMRDIHGTTPVQYAFERNSNILYNTITEIDSSVIISRPVQESQQKEVSNMDIDYISTKKVDEDAQIEREKLQQKKNEQKAKEGIQDDSEEDTVLIDPYSKLEKVGTMVIDSENKAYDTMLIKVDILGWGLYTATSFYKMSIIHNKVLDLYVLWTRWGAYGNEGQHQKTPYLDLEGAVTEFKSIFKSKSGNTWEDRLTNFTRKPGRYELLNTSKHPRDTIIKNFDFLDSNLPTRLSVEVSDLIKLICNFDYLSKVYKESSVDMPLGQIPQRTLEAAQEVLREVSELTKKRMEASSTYSDRAKLQEAKDLDYKIGQKCIEYARLLPRNDDKNQPVRSLYDSDGRNLRREYSRLADLSYVGFAANVLLAAKHNISTMNPLEYAYHTLNCSFRNISSETKASDYQLVKNYIQSTSQGNQKLVHLMAVSRGEEEERFRPFEKETNRKLLWHGSRIGNIMGILKQGLRISPRTTSSNGAMLGNGVYFADTFVKSLGYTNDYYGNQNSSYKMLLLCEVALGSKTSFYDPYSRQTKGGDLHSMKGEGSSTPDPRKDVYNSDGICIPIGSCVPYTFPDSTNQSSYRSSGSTPHFSNNEYAVYDENRIKIRYVVIVRDAATCYLCSKSQSSLMAAQKHNVTKYDYSVFNSFEAEVTKAYLTYKNKSPQDVFDEGLKVYIDTEAYKKHWKIPLELHHDSKICQICAYGITSDLLVQKMTDIETDIPESLKSKPHCIYGKECRTQVRVAHAKKYQHWFLPNTSELNSSENEDDISSKNEDVVAYDEESSDEDSMDTDEE